MQRIHSTFLQMSSATGRLAMPRPNIQGMNKSIAFEPVPRYSVWEEMRHRPDLSDFVTRLNVNEGSKELQVVVANCIDAVAADNVTGHCNNERRHMFGSLVTIYTDRTIKDPFPGGQSLMAYWNNKGHDFKDDSVSQVVVKVNPFGGILDTETRTLSAKGSGGGSCILDRTTSAVANHLYTYPADKVWRVQAVEKVTKHQTEDKLVGNPPVDRSSNLYPFENIEFSPRDCFIAPKGYVLIAADYSQIELRILAHFASDTQLIQAIRNGIDVMKDVASSITGKAYDEVTDEERQQAKAVVYGMLYGQTYGTLAQKLVIPVNEARQFYEKFRDKYPQSSQCLDDIVRYSREKEYVTTLMGRRRYLPAIKSTDRGKRAGAERQAVNSVCQGSAADLVKVAMVRIHEQFQKMERAAEKEKGGQQIPAKLLLQIHDELLFEVREDVVDPISKMIKRAMEKCIELRVPLNVKVKIGKTWGSMKPFQVPQTECCDI